MMHRQHRRGYVLVLTLAVLVLAAGALASAGRWAIAQASRALQAEADLQRRIGVASCRSAILPQVEQILMTQEMRRKSPMPQHRAAVRLGGMIFDLILGDEHAKANMNAMLESDEAQIVQNRLREALSGTGLSAAVALRPHLREDRAVVGGWGQVFDALPPESLLNSRAGRPAPVEWLSCWGGGVINVRRASESSLRLATSPAWTPLDVSRLLDARREMFDPKSTASPPMLRGGVPAAAPPAPRDPVARLLQIAQIRTRAPGLTTVSTCHSLWIITRDGRREWYDLAVEELSGDGSRKVWTFSW